MLVKQKFLNYITEKLAHLKALVATQNAIHFYDINIVAEDFFRELLNAVYDYSLLNLNHANQDAVAIDLGDAEKRVAIQVTSERTKPKVQKTIDKFAANGLADDYDEIKILIIGDRTGNYPTLKLPPSVSFDGKTDVIDIKSLTRKIATLEIDKLRSIADVIKKQMGESSEPLADVDFLEKLWQHSRARCISRWRAVGLDKNEAKDLFDDSNIGAPPANLVSRMSDDLVVVTGDLGTGKSLVAERIHQTSIKAAKNSSDAPIPVYLHALSLIHISEPTRPY